MNKGRLTQLSNDNGYAYVIKGHIDIQLFSKMIEREEKAGSRKFFEICEGPEHVYLKAVPNKGYDSFYIPAKKETRGAFPATIASLW